MKWYSKNLDGFILIESNVIELMKKYEQKASNDFEAGGIFLGYRRGNHLHIVDATYPLSQDKRGRYFFKRIDKGHQLKAVQCWNTSNQKIDYLGEWHTHPQNFPKPSTLDWQEWQKICNCTNNPMIFQIIGSTGNFWLGSSGLDGIIQACSLRS